MISLQTRMAAAAHRDAERTWRRHRKSCYQCEDRQYCDQGNELRDDLRETALELARGRAADCQQIPGQTALPL